MLARKARIVLYSPVPLDSAFGVPYSKDVIQHDDWRLARLEAKVFDVCTRFERKLRGLVRS